VDYLQHLLAACYSGAYFCGIMLHLSVIVTIVAFNGLLATGPYLIMFRQLSFLTLFKSGGYCISGIVVLWACVNVIKLNKDNKCYIQIIRL